MGIVTVDTESMLVRFVHYTAQEYVSRIQHEKLPEAQKTIVNTCLTYLGFDGIGNSSTLHNDYAFASYASKYWSEHVNDLRKSLDVQEHTLLFLHNERKRQSIERAEAALNRRKIRPQLLIHVLARYRLNRLYDIALGEEAGATKR
jgi:hypothetical protein